MQVELAKEQESHTSTVTYRKVTSRRLVEHPRIYRLFMKETLYQITAPNVPLSGNFVSGNGICK